ncbi:transporter substrate-binding domain-containing protein [Uliginosibacterium sp. 31-16]|uniref:substrate-binding periplasmic protein n=1 Tax=Uliginosibacterium sp. 31-16 TaxID=3068315 RepID=UPI00273FE9B8|nr:transporter substrate-binding domain-containing protein [Uliginosibacterium sp. 31-16]MDP5239072.1 transporter substrate-binding domain-containing protein [Uliginosibacterium sp. 31-16]
MIRKTILFLQAFFALVVAGLVQAQADPPVIITYSTNPTYPPYHWAVGDAAFDGASIELLEMVRPANVRFQPLVYPWKRVLGMAALGQIDMLVSLRITPERQQFLRFTEHRSFPNPIAVFVRSDKAFVFTSWDTLQGRTGGYSAGDTFGAGFDDYWRQSLKMDEAPTMENNFAKLALGRIDYFVTSYYLGQAYLQSHSDKAGIIALTPMISTQDIHFAFSKKFPHQSVINEIDKRLAELNRRGVPEALLKKHLERFSRNPVIYAP